MTAGLTSLPPKAPTSLVAGIHQFSKKTTSKISPPNLKDDLYHSAWSRSAALPCINTLTELKEKRKAEIMAIEALWDNDFTSGDNSDNDKLDDAWPDVVATQGAYLAPRTNTPVFRDDGYKDFASRLTSNLEGVLIEQECRTNMYHGAADEWAMGHTPPELKEKRKAELEALDALWGITSDDDNAKAKASNDIDARVGPGNPAAPEQPQRPHQADWLPTPPLSAKSPLATPRRGKRRRTSTQDEENGRLAKKHISSAQEVSATAEDAAPTTAQQKGQKRRRTLDVDDEQEGEGKERPSKVRVSTAPPSSIWRQRLRAQPRRPAS